MEYGKFSVSFTYIFFLGKLPQMFLQLCLCVVVFKTCLFHTQSITLTALHENFFVTPLALHTHLSCVSDELGQHLLPQTLSLVTCNSTLGGLPCGLATLFWSSMCQYIPHEGISKICV
jgi:hypothetical protein